MTPPPFSKETDPGPTPSGVELTDHVIRIILNHQFLNAVVYKGKKELEFCFPKYAYFSDFRDLVPFGFLIFESGYNRFSQADKRHIVFNFRGKVNGLVTSLPCKLLGLRFETSLV